MQYIEAPEDKKAKFKSVFLAGGITNCPNWQMEIIEKLKDEEITVFNPRRKDFSKDNKEQIEWEYKKLREADLISFWFSRGSLNPIALFELGSAMERKELIIGIDREYPRREDVEIQVFLRRPEIEIVYSLEELLKNIIKTIR